MIRKAEKDAECLELAKKYPKAGYAQIQFNGRTENLHRVAWIKRFGPIFDDLILHQCDNRKCSRIIHLARGNNSENQRDRRLKERIVRSIGRLTTAERILIFRLRRKLEKAKPR